MTVNELIEELKKHDGDIEVFMPNIINICGNINSIYSLKKDTYGVFGGSLDCIILSQDENEE